MLLLVKDLGRVMALNRRRHIILPPSPQRLKQRKGKSREKRGKEEARSFWKQKKKSMPWWGLSAGHMWYSPTGNIPWNATSVYLKDRQGMLAQPLQGKLFRQEAQEIVWEFCTWGWRNLQLSYRTVSKYKWFCGLTPWLVMDQDYRNFMTMHKAILLQRLKNLVTCLKCDDIF